MAGKSKDKTNGAPSGDGIKLVGSNRAAWHHFEIQEKLECGMVLVGSEVKSLRNHSVSFSDSYCRVIKGELFVIGLHIAEYKEAGISNHAPDRTRKLLASKREIRKLEKRISILGMTLVPLSVYFKHGKAKIEVGVARGKNKGDKRQALKEKTVKREMDRMVKR
ncbi:MAG: SsrA-binding protein SmpB [Planctomycetota bacterium]